MNILTGLKTEITTTALVALGYAFINWVKIQTKQPYLQDYWLAQGMTLDDIDVLTKSEPEFKELVIFGNDLIGGLWGDRLRDDMQTIRHRSNIYLREFKKHDIEMIEVRERIKKQLEKEDSLTPQQQQALFNSFMEPYLKGQLKKNDESSK